MNGRTFLVAALVSVGLAFVLSLLFWLVFDVFVLSGFIIWSVVSGVAGAGLAALLKRALPAALVSTAVIRIVIFVVLSGLWF